ncbi:glycosyltransferase [Reinekea sp.]|jgi:glycosyltransferase involved in cell wall biosynthesis|uniref:glycosyltransferase n=1 Tax=Reinekea sp. TaxID=1970455 RepID=UPI003989B672
MLVFLFWVLLVCSLYSYFFYPVVLHLLTKSVKPSQSVDDVQAPHFYSLIVTVYNEKHRIKQKLENLLSLEFDKDQYELIIASDSSDDGTDDIVRKYESKGVRLVRATERLGKENAQLTAIKAAKGSVLVFSDVATIMEPNALTKLDGHFQNENIGAVSSEDRFVSKSGEVAGEGAYVKYEMWLRNKESKLAGLVGLSGSFFAARTEICADWDIHSPSDFNTALNCARAGKQSISAPDVLGFYEDLKDPSKEYARKVRTVLRGITGLSRHLDVLNPFKFGLFSLQVFSHKLMRWGVPWFLMALLIVTSFVVHHGWVYQMALVGQILFYVTALLAHLSPKLQSVGPIKLVYFFVQVNIALMDSMLKFATGTRMTTWKPSAR